MKTDDNYYYPETPEELSAFYGMECEINDGFLPWSKWQIIYTDLDVDFSHIKFRIPKFTLDDLKVGDVVKGLAVSYNPIFMELEYNEDLEGFKEDLRNDYIRLPKLLISRNLWVEVKV